MTALVEVHDEDEIAPRRRRRRRASSASTPATCAPSRSTARRSRRLRPLIPDDVVKIAESGVRGVARRPRLRAAGAHGGPRRRGPGHRRRPRPRTGRAVPSPGGRRPRPRPGPARPRRAVRASTHAAGSASSAAGSCPRRSSPRSTSSTTVRLKAMADPEFVGELERLHRTYTGRPSILTEVPRFAEHAGGRAGHPQARGPQPHRLAQDQQRARPGPADQADGQDPRHRRDRRRPARRRHGDRRRAARASSAPSTWARRTPSGRRSTSRGCGCSAPRSSPSPSARQTLKDAINEALRDWVANVDDTHYLLGTVTGPHPFPEMVRDFHRIIGDRGPGAGPRPGRPAPGRRRSPASAAGPTRWASSTRSSTTPASGWSASRPAERASPPGGTPRGSRPASPACCTARSPTSCRTRTARRVESHSVSAGLDYPSVGPEHAWLHDIGRAEYRSITDDAGHGGVPAAVPDRGDHPGDRVRARAGRRHARSAAELGRDGRCCWSTSPAAATRTSTRPRPGSACSTAKHRRRSRTPRGSGCRRERPATARRAPAGPRAGPPSSATCRSATPTSPGSIAAMTAMVEAGVDIVEVGLPYSDPLMDGPVDPARRRGRPGRRHAGVDDVFTRLPSGRRHRRARPRHDLLEPGPALRRRRLRRATSPRAVPPA